MLSYSLCLCLSIIYVHAFGTVHHATHVFNAIHSSMRQWGSSLNHNGVSFFRVKVPQGIHLYHGTWTSERFNVMDWLAFEPEHAMNFAFGICDEDLHVLSDEVRQLSPKWWFQSADLDFVSNMPPSQEVLISEPGEPPHQGRPCFKPGWFHTYAPIRNLALLYIDGMSAGKSILGTLDSQDFVLLWNSSLGHHQKPSPIMNDRGRALGLCKLAEEDFEGKIDGFIRMEHGFEIILCDWTLLQTVSILRSSRDDIRSGPMGGRALDSFNFFRAITSRYSGIGGQRVIVDYNNFVTAFDYPEIDLWHESYELP